MSEFIQSLRDLGDAHALYKAPSAQLVQDNSLETRRTFASAWQDGGYPVVIPCHNEVEDLPRTLVSIARGGNLLPVVVDNNSTDETAAVARRMGAIVIPSGAGKKTAATQAGLSFCHDELGADTILFTDADTCVQPRWGSAMVATLRSADQGAGAALFGHSLISHEKSLIVCGVINLFRTGRLLKRSLTDGHPVVRGHNYGLRLDDDDVMTTALGDLDPWCFGQDDVAIKRHLRLRTAAALVGSINPATWVVTRGNRIETIPQLAKAIFDRAGTKKDLRTAYKNEYGSDIT